MQRRCDRNRKRSQRRAIYCLVHGCCITSVSQKYPLFADRPGQLQARGLGRRDAQILINANTAVHLGGEWLEAFWCEECQETKWYHVHKHNFEYELSVVPAELWKQATKVAYPHGNPTVGEFTQRQSRIMAHRTINDFKFMN